MNKGLKISIGIILAIAIMLLVAFFILHNKEINIKGKIDTDVGVANSGEKLEENENIRIVRLNGKLYYDTGKTSDALRCGMMDGEITSNVEKNQIPEQDNQSNFEGTYGYQGAGNKIEINIDGKWCIFETKEKTDEDIHSFYGKVIESNQNSIIVEPNEEEEIRKSADKISISLGKDNDVIYEAGTNVKITYSGYVMETYPAQVKVTNIELKSAENFEIRFYDKHPQTDTKINKILDKSETEKYSYNIYTYDGQVNIFINGEEISLRNALLNNKITMEEIISKANQDLNDKKISGDTYRDGGSIVYKYDNYTIIKCHTLDGNRDVYIGTKELDINDVI